MEEEEKREGEGGPGDELEEAAAGVLGVGETRGKHAPGAAEQVTHLYDEREEQDIQETEHYPDLDGAQGEPPRTPDRERSRDTGHQRGPE